MCEYVVVVHVNDLIIILSDLKLLNSPSKAHLTFALALSRRYLSLNQRLNGKVHVDIGCWSHSHLPLFWLIKE